MYPLYHDICDMVEFHEKIGISNENPSFDSFQKGRSQAISARSKG